MGRRIIEKLRKDSFGMGMFLGALIPARTFGFIYLIVYFVEHYTGKTNIVDIQKIILLSVIPNLFLLRYYLLKLKYDLVGRGIVVLTFVIGIIFAVFEFVL